VTAEPLSLFDQPPPRRQVNHGPNCVACTDPAKAVRQIAARRAGLELEAEAARESRAHSDRVRDQWYPQQPNLAPADWQAVQTVVIEAARLANLLMQGVLMERAHLERVEEAHGLAQEAA
jgi:hypothetical protein